MKLRAMSALAASALVAVVAATALGSYHGGSSNNPSKLRAGLSGRAEVPGPGDRNGSGRAFITLQPRARRVCYRITFRRIGRAVAAHIHRGGRRVAGDIVVALFERPGVRSPERGCTRGANRRQIRRIRRRPGRFYVNVHTRPFPDGAIRGQLRRR